MKPVHGKMLSDSIRTGYEVPPSAGLGSLFPIKSGSVLAARWRT
jgi:hypothetical protein